MQCFVWILCFFFLVIFSLCFNFYLDDEKVEGKGSNIKILSWICVSLLFYSIWISPLIPTVIVKLQTFFSLDAILFLCTTIIVFSQSLHYHHHLFNSHWQSVYDENFAICSWFLLNLSRLLLLFVSNTKFKTLNMSHHVIMFWYLFSVWDSGILMT